MHFLRVTLLKVIVLSSGVQGFGNKTAQSDQRLCYSLFGKYHI